MDEATKRLPVSQGLTGTNYKLTGKSGEVSLVYQQIYHLKKIKTTSHTAVFIKDTRKDEVSGHITTTYTATITPTPQLRTTRIILFKNDRLDSILASATTSAIATGGDNSVFDFNGTTNGSAHFFTENWYTYYLNSHIKNRVLNHVEFTQDYSLCRNYHGNVGVSSLTCSVISPPATVQSNIAAVTYSTSGKLTLTKIQSYEFQNVKISPSYTFDYNQSDSNDNPDYNPQKTDYWGFYKSDVSSAGYSGYTTSTSKEYTDAWSLRKVMQPLGGYLEFEYESNSYKKVLDNTNGYRGAAFIYPITSLAVNSNTNSCIDLTMEEPTNPSEFASLMSGTVSGVTKTICTPMSHASLSNYPSTSNYFTYILFGNFTHSGTSSFTVSSIDSYVEQYHDNIDCFYGLDPGGHDPGTLISASSSAYSGNGYIMLQTEPGYEVYGGGPRIKKIKTFNSASEVYVQEYTYEEGVAAGEADRFEFPVAKASCGLSEYFVNKHSPATYDKHSLGTSIGYGKVTAKNMGRSNTANGSIVNQFVNSYTVNGTYLPNHQVTGSHFSRTTSSLTPTEYMHYYECFDKYSSFWGLTTESKVLDVNNNIISKTTYEYQNTDQGAIVENFLFLDNTTYTNPRYFLSILRHYPVVLKKTRSYGMGSYSESETLRRDEVTGEAVLMRSVGQNSSTAISFKTPAFRVSTFSGMGPKSVNSSNKNFVTAEAYSFSSVDTVLTTVTSNVSSSFLSAGATLYKTTSNVRMYNGFLNPFSNQSHSTQYWKPGASYGWSGVQGSVDEHGLYKRSQLTSNPFNYASPASGSAHWRFGSETTLSDSVGHALEVRSYNNRFNAYKFGYNNDHVIATCANSNYASFTYSGFEAVMPYTSNDFADGEMSLPSTGYTIVPTSTVTPHTGYRCLSLASGAKSYYQGFYSNNGTYETGIERGRMYRAIVWVNASTPSSAYLNALVTGVGYSQNYTMYANNANAITIGNWTRISVDFKIPDNIVTTGGTDVAISISGGTGTTYFDDFMFYPVEGSIKANVYNPGNGRLIAELNSLGYATFFTYDEAGRPLETRQEIPGNGIKLVKRNSYNFARNN